MEYSKLSIKNINQISNYIKIKLKNPIAAENFKINIEKSIYNLSYFPYIGVKYKKTKNRFKIYKNFLIFYEIQEKEKLVIIKRIIHKSANL